MEDENDFVFATFFSRGTMRLHGATAAGLRLRRVPVTHSVALLHPDGAAMMGGTVVVTSRRAAFEICRRIVRPGWIRRQICLLPKRKAATMLNVSERRSRRVFFRDAIFRRGGVNHQGVKYFSRQMV